VQVIAAGFESVGQPRGVIWKDHNGGPDDDEICGAELGGGGVPCAVPDSARIAAPEVPVEAVRGTSSQPTDGPDGADADQHLPGARNHAQALLPAAH